MTTPLPHYSYPAMAVDGDVLGRVGALSRQGETPSHYADGVQLDRSLMSLAGPEPRHRATPRTEVLRVRMSCAQNGQEVSVMDG